MGIWDSALRDLSIWDVWICEIYILGFGDLEFGMFGLGDLEFGDWGDWGNLVIWYLCVWDAGCSHLDISDLGFGICGFGIPPIPNLS